MEEVRNNVAIYSHTLLRIHVIGGQRSVRTFLKDGVFCSTTCVVFTCLKFECLGVGQLCIGAFRNIGPLDIWAFVSVAMGS